MHEGEAARKLFKKIVNSGKDGVQEVKPHEGDILVRLFEGYEAESEVPARFEGFRVRKSYYQTATHAQK